MLKEQYHLLEGSKAVGIDGITKIAYGERLEENIKQLLVRIRKGSRVAIKSALTSGKFCSI
jgi:RNA-directed DNA polymerase